MNGSANTMIMFRTSRKGYDKGDVHRYIEEMNIRFAASEEKAKQQLRLLEEALNRAEAATPVADEAATEMLLQENAALKAELEAQKAVLAQAREEASRLAKEEDQVLSYNEASKRLGDILLKANLDADRIVAEAEAEATRQLSGAEKKADDIRLDAAVTARLMTERVKHRLVALTEEYVKNLEAFSRASSEEYCKFFDELKERLDAAHLEASVVLREGRDEA